jgi:hypothetical protein
MARQVLRAACVTLVFVALGATASAAGGDGLPVGNIDAGGTGIAGPGDARYVTIPAGARTVVARIDRRNGRVTRSAAVRGNFTIPAVALDASTAGLSADGETLVLIRPRANFPQSRTQLLVLDAQRLRPVRRVNLRGDFSFDAVSPDGGSIYLVEYLSRRDPTRYAVRTYDVERGRLQSAPVVDKSEPGERMRGYPVTRVDGSGGRWAYTLYDGAGGHPFVHALDTVEQTAVCIDLDGLTGRKDLQALRLSIDPGQEQLSVVKGADPVALIDTRTFAVKIAAEAAPPEDESSSSAAPWLAGGLVALLLAATVARTLRRRRPATSH